MFCREMGNGGKTKNKESLNICISFFHIKIMTINFHTLDYENCYAKSKFLYTVISQLAKTIHSGITFAFQNL